MIRFENLREYYNQIYGIDAVNGLLTEGELRFKPIREIMKFIDKYDRRKFDNTLSGCDYCNQTKGVQLYNQDFPFWTGDLNEGKDFIVLGLEVASFNKVGKRWLHVCYMDEIGNLDKYMSESIALLFEDFQNNVYITDIGKCWSSIDNELKITRSTCISLRFFEELRLLEQLNPNFTFILQGNGRSYHDLDIQNLVHKRTFLHTNEKNYTFFNYGQVGGNDILRNKHRVLVFPHTGDRNRRVQWPYIRRHLQQVKDLKDLALKANFI